MITVNHMMVLQELPHLTIHCIITVPAYVVAGILTGFIKVYSTCRSTVQVFYHVTVFLEHSCIKAITNCDRKLWCVYVRTCVCMCMCV